MKAGRNKSVYAAAVRMLKRMIKLLEARLREEKRRLAFLKRELRSCSA